MKNTDILNIGKYSFGISFLLGNICLFGYIFTKNPDFAGGGLMLLAWGSAINLIIIFILLVYGISNKPKLDICLKASGIILLNIPLAILYTVIGLSIL